MNKDDLQDLLVYAEVIGATPGTPVVDVIARLDNDCKIVGTTRDRILTAAVVESTM